MLKKKLFNLLLILSLTAANFSGSLTLAATGVKTVSAKASTTDKKSFARGKNLAETIRAEWLKDYLSYIASNEMEGRDTPSRGLDLTAKFIALNLKQWGVKPAGDDGTYFQKIALKQKKVNPNGSFIEFGGKKFKHGEDFFAWIIRGKVSNAPVVFVKNGWVIKPKNLNPYKSLDVRGKIVVTDVGLPAGMNFAELQNMKQGVDYFYPQTAAKDAGAAAVIEISTPQTLNYASNLSSKGSLAMEKFLKPNANSVPALVAAPALLNALFEGERISGADVSARKFDSLAEESFALSADKKINLNITVEEETKYTQNVVGLVEGSDPILKKEMVAFGAHYDHVGVNENAPGADKIWNGADDDGSGTVAILAMAKAFAEAAPRAKRSALFVWHAAEEKGLWGSQYFSEFPTVPLENIVAQLNIDMIGRSRPATDTNPKNKVLVERGEIYVIGSKKMSDELGALSERVNDVYLKLKFNYLYDDPNDPNKFFYRSDHFHYARKNIPIIFYFDGVYEDYHQPGDEVEKIDFEQMQMVARTIFLTGWELANVKTRPKVDRPLPPEMTKGMF